MSSVNTCKTSLHFLVDDELNVSINNYHIFHYLAYHKLNLIATNIYKKYMTSCYRNIELRFAYAKDNFILNIRCLCETSN